jgi:hypothetical protein
MSHLNLNKCQLTRRSPLENRGAGKLGLSRRIHHAKRDTIFIKELGTLSMARNGLVYFGSYQLDTWFVHYKIENIQRRSLFIPCFLRERPSVKAQF